MSFGFDNCFVMRSITHLAKMLIGCSLDSLWIKHIKYKRTNSRGVHFKNIHSQEIAKTKVQIT